MEEGRDKRATVFWRDNEVGWTRSDGGNITFVLPINNLFDERNQAVKKLLQYVISLCNKKGKYIGIFGQGSSDYPDFAEWLMSVGIKYISLNPDTIVSAWMMLAGKKSDVAIT